MRCCLVYMVVVVAYGFALPLGSFEHIAPGVRDTRSYVRREPGKFPLPFTTPTSSSLSDGSDEDEDEYMYIKFRSLDPSVAQQFFEAIESLKHDKALFGSTKTNPDCQVRYANLSHPDPHGCIISDSDSRQFLPTGNYSRLFPVMTKLKAGGKVTLLVLGGSMTCGMETCQTNDLDLLKESAWPARFGRWLQQKYPNSHVNVQNRCLPGATADVHLGLLGITLASLNYDVDLVFVDTSVNGGTSEAIEALVRFFHGKRMPVFGMVTFPSDDSEMIIYERYGMPRLDFFKLVLRTPRLWVPPCIIKDKGVAMARHPGWQTHQAIAEVLASTWQHASDSASNIAASDLSWSSTTSLSPMFPTANKIIFCEKPLNSFSAKAQSLPGPLPQGWRVFEDRVGKPGFITQTMNAEWQFPLRFGTQPSIGVSYLKTYNNSGMARVQLRLNQHPPVIVELSLDGRWKPHKSETVMWQKDLPMGFMNKTGYITFSLVAGDKFKITDIMSC